MSGNSWPRHALLRLLCSLAFDAALFERSTWLLIRVALDEELDNKIDSAAEALASLFQIVLSGTRATVEQRVSVADELLQAEDERSRGLGLLALGAAFNAGHFSSSHSFEFGARSRDHGYQPRTIAEVRHWYSLFLDLATRIGFSNLAAAERVRSLVADRFHRLWSSAGAHDALEATAASFSALGYWGEGWVAVRRVLRLDGSRMDEVVQARLHTLERRLAPQDVAQRVQAFVLSPRTSMLDILNDDTTTEGIHRAQARLEELGREVGRDPGLVRHFLPELMRCDSSTIWSFARGLALSVSEPEAVWDALVSEIGRTPELEVRNACLRGFLNGLHERCPERAAALLDDAVEQDELARWFPHLQVAVEIGREGTTRLLRSLAFGAAPVAAFHSLVHSQATEDLPEPELTQLLNAVAAKPGGLEIALDMLGLRLYPAVKNGSRNPTLVASGRELLRLWKPNDTEQRVRSCGRAACRGLHGRAGWERDCRPPLPRAPGRVRPRQGLRLPVGRDHVSRVQKPARNRADRLPRGRWTSTALPAVPHPRVDLRPSA